MFDYLQGKLTEKNPTYVVVDCNGIGYWVNISLNTYSALESLQTACVFVHLSVREDAWVLYGFADRDERRLFRLLISVSGVGPSTAQLILSSMSPGGVVDAIHSGNVAALQSVKGIGGKTAQRIIVDLKDKIDKIDIQKVISTSSASSGSAKQEALAALMMLGFAKQSADKVLDKVIKEQGSSLPVEDMIKHALQNI